MEPIYVGDLILFIASSKKIIEKYDIGIKKRNFIKNLLAEVLISLIGKYACYKKKLLPWQIGLKSSVSAWIRILLLMNV